MSGVLRYIQRLLGRPQKVYTPLTRSFDLSRFREGERVLVDGRRLSGPLKRNDRHDTPKGFIAHNDIIGQAAVRSMFRTNAGFHFEVARPTLDEYVALTPRKVTPVRPWHFSARTECSSRTQ